jgi:hypothetical protein
LSEDAFSKSAINSGNTFPSTAVFTLATRTTPALTGTAAAGPASAGRGMGSFFEQPSLASVRALATTPPPVSAKKLRRSSALLIPPSMLSS